MFGQNKTGFGNTSFGASSAFGATTPFGGGTNSTFGAKTTGSTGFNLGGGFNQQTPASSSTLFGGTTTSTASTGLFGGGTSAFGGQTQTTGGLFGATTQGSSMFGTPTSSTAFGAKTPATGFGATQQTGGLFGTTQTAGGTMFGAAQPAPNATPFGQPTVFGAGGAGSGTTIKFNPPAGTDTMLKGGVSQNINTRHQCITAMKEYENKSLEELRMEDYVANRKGPQQGGGLFGATQAAPSTGFSFGPNKPAGFTGFGTTGTTGLFGGQAQPQQPQQTTSLFGASTKPSLFGTTTTTSTATPGFGGFGTNTQNTGTSLFGATQPTQPPTGLFGQAGATGTGGLFGATPTTSATAFGATNTGFGFGQNTQQTGGLFGNKPTGFGTATTSSTLFGQPNQAGGLFSKPATSTGFGFGTQNQTPGFGANTGTSLFNKPATGFANSTGFGTGLGTGLGGTGGGLFNQPNKPLGTGLGTGFGAGTSTLGGLGGMATSTGLGLNQAQPQLGSLPDSNVMSTQIQQQLLALANSPYGDSPLFRNLKQDDNRRDDALKPTNPAAQKAVLSMGSQYKVSPRPTAKIKPKLLQSPINGKSQLFEGLEDDDSTFGNDTFVPRKSIKKLVLKNQNRSPGQSITSRSPTQSQSRIEEDLVAPSPISPIGQQRNVNTSGGKDRTPGDGLTFAARKFENQRTDSPAQPNGSCLDDTIAVLNSHNRVQIGRNSSLDESVLPERDEDLPPSAPHPVGIVLTRPGYYTLPTLDEIAEIGLTDGKCIVDNFVIGRTGYGNVFFEGDTDVANLNLDDTVHFRRKEITVYPDDTIKPQEGEGLNKVAQVTLDCVWPNDKSTGMPIKDMNRLIAMGYQEKIERATGKIGAKFVDYRPETGSWVFEVKHFSKYGLLDESDEEDGEIDPEKLKMLQEKREQLLAVQKQKIAFQQKQLEEQQKRLQAETQQQKKLEDVPEQTQKQPRMEEDDSDMADITREMRPRGFSDSIDNLSQEEGETEMADAEDASPSSHRLGTKLGVNTQTVQVMKASFFDDDDMDIDRPAKAFSHGLLGSRASPAPGTPLLRGSDRAAPMQRGTASPSEQPSPLKRSFIYERVQAQPPQATARVFPLSKLPPAPEHIVLPSGLSTHQAKKVAGTRITAGVPPLDESVMNSKSNLVLDAGLLRGRGCRVGWGPGLAMVHCGLPIHQMLEDKEETAPSVFPHYNAAKKPRLNNCPYEVVIEKINVNFMSSEDAMVKKLLEQSLEIQLENTQCSTESICPLFVPTPGVEGLHKHAEHADDHVDKLESSHTHLVWKLVEALWGALPEYPDELDIDQSSYAYHQARRAAFSRWLMSAAEKYVHSFVNSKKMQGDDSISAVLALLTGGRISDACKLAQQSGDHRLALLLTQSMGSEPTRHMLAKQLETWQEQKTDQFISEDRLKVYTMLSGLMVHPASDREIHVCKNLDWKRCLAIHMWYQCTPMATVADGLRTYDSAFHGKEGLPAYAAPPLPPYLEEADEEKHRVCDLSGRYVILDMCYHLLRLYSDKGHPLDRLLAPTTTTANHLDFKLSWLLWQVLQSLEYSHLSEYHATALCTSFAAQLENTGLWHWAVFVLLHIVDDERRQQALKSTLERHISLSQDQEYIDRENFLLQELRVPAGWIHEAKARRAKYERRPHKEAWHLLKAGHWHASHRIILKHVAPDAIINENYDYLKRYLRELSPPENSASIQGWNTGGKVFLDYINMMETLEEIKKGDLGGYELERLVPEVTSLCKRVSDLPCHTAKDRLCQSEIAKRMANLLRTLLLLKEGGTSTKHVPTRLIAPHISALPMPEDYSLQELRDLVRSYMLEMTLA